MRFGLLSKIEVLRNTITHQTEVEDEHKKLCSTKVEDETTATAVVLQVGRTATVGERVGREGGAYLC